jgi:hypothetical protein
MLIWVILGCTLAGSLSLLAVAGLRERILHRLAAAAGLPPGGGTSPPLWLRSLEFILELMREVGIGGLVGFFVAATFELSLHRQAEREYEEKLHDAEENYNKQLAQIKTNVFEAALGAPLDQELWRETKETVFSQHLVREDLKVTFDFQASDATKRPVGGEQMLDLKLTVFYRLRNTGLAPRDHPIAPRHEELPTLTPTDGRYLQLDVVGCMGEEIHLPTRAGEELTVYDKLKRSLRNVPNGGRVWIAPGKAAKVTWVYQTPRRYQDKFIWRTVLPARSLTVIARKKGTGVDDLQFALGTAHRLKEQDSTITEPEPGAKQWEIRAAFLPYQGVFLDWWPLSKEYKP